MATKKSQRIGIWIILIALVAGTIGGSLVMVLEQKNGQSDQARFTTLQQEYEKEGEAYKKMLSEKYLPLFSTYQNRNAAFDASSVTALKVDELRAGDGEVITSGTTKYMAYYMGWLPDGSVFDGSFAEDKTLRAPLDASQSLIEGWNKGMDGAKIGAIRELTIPAAQAYGDKGAGSIPANSPLKFIVMTIPYTAPPQPSEEFIKLYQRLQGGL